MAVVEIRTFGQAAYEAYAASCGGRSITGAALPWWGALSPSWQERWETAAEPVAATGP